MDSLISFLCLYSFFVPSAFGVGLTLLLERSFGLRAYWIGWLLPLILLAGLYGADVLWTWATPCEPARSLKCGEPAAYTLILFVGTFFLTAVVNGIAQAALFWFLPVQRQARSMVLMKCPKCGTIMYESIGGTDICPDCGFGSASAARRQQQIAEYHQALTEGTPGRIIASGGWALYIYFRLQGSKSEGQHGILLHNSEPVESQQVGQVIDTDLGQMKYYCRFEDMEVPWEPTGWNFADRGKIQHSTIPLT